jgi:hypothetical protein
MGSATASLRGRPALGPGRRMIGRARAASTPTALRLATGALVIALIAFGAVGVRVATDRQEAVDTVRSEGAPLVAATGSLYVALADADAAASTAYLRAGLEPPNLRDRYEKDIATAARELAAIASSRALPDEARDALVTLHEQLPLYAADIETARTNNRLGFTVGAAYQRQASDRMQGTLLPAATGLYEAAARRLDESHRSGTSLAAEIAVIVVATIVVGLLAAVHVFLTARTRRLLNVGLIGAAVIVVAVGTLMWTGLRSQRDALADSRRQGSDPMLLLSTARILALQSMSDENLDLIARPDAAAMADFEASTASIRGGGGQPGLLDQAAQRAEDSATVERVSELDALHRQFLDAHQRVRAFADGDDYNNAIAVASSEEAAASAALDRAFMAAIAASLDNLDDGADAAAHDLRLLPYASMLAALAAAAAVAAGMSPRLREYQ